MKESGMAVLYTDHDQRHGIWSLWEGVTVPTLCAKDIKFQFYVC